MKKILVLLLLTYTIMFSFSQENDYNNGNGTIIETKTDDGIELTIRRHIQNIKIGDLADEENLIVYDKPSLNNRNKTGTLRLNDDITITQVAEIVVAAEYYSWLLINMNNTEGWILFNKLNFTDAGYFAPYFNNRWEILGITNAGNRIWTRRRMLNQLVTYWAYDNLTIRDKPGTIGTKIIGEIIPPINASPQINLEVTEATEEIDTIEGCSDRWLKIEYDGIDGWIFGGDISVERGGPKYYTPESLISFRLGWR